MALQPDEDFWQQPFQPPFLPAVPQYNPVNVSGLNEDFAVTVNLGARSGAFTLQDGAGGIWLVTVNNSGQLQTTATTGGFITPVFDDGAGSVSWLLGVQTNGLLTTTSWPFSASYPSLWWTGSFDATTTWGIGVLKNGQLFTIPSPTFLEDSCIGGFSRISYGF
jgi:hypothetical protein